MAVLPCGKGNLHFRHLGKPEVMVETFAVSTPQGSPEVTSKIWKLSRGQVQQERHCLAIKKRLWEEKVTEPYFSPVEFDLTSQHGHRVSRCSQFLPVQRTAGLQSISVSH